LDILFFLINWFSHFISYYFSFYIFYYYNKFIISLHYKSIPILDIPFPMNTLMEHDRFLHTTKHEECNVSLHACGDFKQVSKRRRSSQNLRFRFRFLIIIRLGKSTQWTSSQIRLRLHLMNCQSCLLVLRFGTQASSEAQWQVPQNEMASAITDMSSIHIAHVTCR
jgi:hypothetical protein